MAFNAVYNLLIYILDKASPNSVMLVRLEKEHRNQNHYLFLTKNDWSKLFTYKLLISEYICEYSLWEKLEDTAWNMESG